MNPQPEIIYGGKEEADPEVIFHKMFMFKSMWI